MADVFISYAREDHEEASAVAKAIEADGYLVWWDRQILGGDNFDVVIERELDSARIVVVLWSKSSVASAWVRAEAAAAAERGALIPASIENIKPPLQFRQKQTVDLTSWRGDPKAPEFLPMRQALAARLGREATPPTLPVQPRSRIDGRTLLAILLATLGIALISALATHFYTNRGENSASENEATLPAPQEEAVSVTQKAQDTPVRPQTTSPPEPTQQEPREESPLAGPKPAARPSLCEKYGTYTADSWRQNFLHEQEAGKWHVFVASLDPGKSESDAESRAQEFRRYHPKHDFLVMPTVNALETGNQRYAVVIAQGVANGTVAREIAAYASRCGISPGAYAYQQTL